MLDTEICFTDRGMQLHYGRFMSNGKCGYVLKPPYMRPQYSDSNGQRARLKVKEERIRADYADYHSAARVAQEAYDRAHRQKAPSTTTGALA